MDTRELLAPDATAPLGRSRARVLDLLRDAGSAVTANEVADQCGMHPNTARFHLDALVEAGLAVRDNGTAQGGPGRPAVGYRSADAGEPGAASGERRFRLLAQMLASLVAGLVDDPAETAERAGREWGAFLTEPPPPYRRQSAAAAIAELTGLLASMGFDPQVEADATAGSEETPWQPAGRPRILLRECPFREVAKEHQAVVCSLHLGVVRGALDRMRAPLAADRLEVFPEPGVCRMHLTISGKHEGREHAQ